MVDALGILTSIAVVLLVGMLLSAFAYKIRIPDVLLLLIAGMLIGSIPYQGRYLIEFPTLFLTATSILALAIIVFNSASRLKFRELDQFSARAMWLTLVFLLLNVIVLSVAFRFIFGLPIIFGILLATIVSGTAPEITLSLMERAKDKAIEILKIESLINTPLTVLFPFLILDFITGVEIVELAAVIEQIVPFLAKFVAGIGAGMLIGLIMFKGLKGTRSKVYLPLSVIIGALLAYVLAENLGGNGVLAVTTLGLFVGNIYKKEKIEELLSFETLLAKSLYILVFVLIGFIIKLQLTLDFLWRASALLGIYLIVRYISVAVVFPPKSKEFTFGQRLFMTLSAPKGIAVAVVAFTLTTFLVPGSVNYLPGPEIRSVLDLTLFFMLASIILATLALMFSKGFLGEAVLPEKK